MESEEKRRMMAGAWLAERERRERLEKYYRNLMISSFGFLVILTCLFLFQETILVVGLVFLFLEFIGIAFWIYLIIRNC